ncbi:13198_t:CDS:2 [Entrophospora sp. SA101]|nr:13198_t:CDS:2 [Entrophospora sp. SA101]
MFTYVSINYSYCVSFIRNLVDDNKWALESQVANKEKDAIDNYILGTKHS